ncbi:putative ferric-chelate reductase [Lindgomyces ingoldianus]|uniref:Ferric-chelate reductase n=1 Tax=Lindgomyces ingoldianus TaxID=673940 RepID=A0ACB6R343_9PLEO|nr:putative ferric-chelate reductase [Lindgomyces ingoldianus]KAF2473683.1 putative ferric-chelate reductase [Lindgomyces ingoldianus]
MLSFQFFGVALLLISTATCMTSQGRKGHGLIGYGIVMYKPNCASACRDCTSTGVLNCSTVMEDDKGMDMGGMDMTETSPECYATDDVFLQTLAYCISVKCAQLPDWEKEKWWKLNVAGRNQVQPNPKESYRQALDMVTSPPTEIMVSGEPLNKTMLVSEDDYVANWNAEYQFEKQEEIHERYGIVLVVSCFVIPIAFSLLRFVPFPGSWVTRFNAWIIDPPLWGVKHKQPLSGGLGLIPTRGQSIFLSYILIMNIVLSAANFHSVQPNAWSNTRMEIMDYITNRVGVLSFANIPLLILYSSRNNILLKLTDWSHATFLLMHRWVAGIATIQAILHSLLWLRMDLETHKHATESKQPYWYWGIIATLSMTILLPTSVLAIRQKMYELFLAWHVALSILAIAGCYWHIIFRFQHQWGYETWIYTAMAVWGFDRVMRLLRVARHGIRTARVTQIDDDYVRVDVPGVAASGHAYLYFPTLTWRFWENHPFSVASAVIPQFGDRKTKSLADEEAGPLAPTKDDIHVSTASAAASDSEKGHTHQPATLGLTFLLRRQAGLTTRFSSRSSLPVLVEASYGAHIDTSSHPHLLCIVGGIGITAVLPYLRSHAGSSKLYWGVRSEGIVHAVKDMLQGINKEVFIGHRMNIRKVLGDELGFAGASGVVVIVSGPPSMADEVRAVVSEIGRKGAVNVRLIDEAFSW